MGRPIPRQFRHTVPGFAIDSGDVVQLWNYLSTLMESPPPECDLQRVATTIEARQGGESNYESTRQEELEGFFENPNLPSRISGFTLNFNATYKGRDARGPFQFSRRVGLNTYPAGESEVVIAGEPGWIPIVKDYLDPFIKNHRRSIFVQQAAVIVAFWLAPILLLILAAAKFRFPTLNAGAFAWGAVGAVVLLFVTSGEFPDSVVITRPEGRVEKWFVRRPAEVLIGAFAALLAAVVLYLVPFGH